MVTETSRGDFHKQEKDLGIKRGTYGKRRSLRMSVGPMDVEVWGIPASQMGEEDWGLFKQARGSYNSMWGGNSLLDRIEEDPFDGIGVTNVQFKTDHYYAVIGDSLEPPKTLTLRKVSFVAARKVDTETSDFNKLILPDDVTFWQVKDVDTGQAIPFWSILRSYSNIGGTVISNSAASRLRLASLSRTGTYPYNIEEREEMQRERSGIAFAAMEILATDHDRNEFFVSQLCPEFRERVLSLRMVDGNLIMPAFYRSEDILNLPKNLKFELNNGNRDVYEHKTHFPGYWLDSALAKKVLLNLLEQGKLNPADFKTALDNVLVSCVGAREQTRLFKDLIKVGLMDTKIPPTLPYVRSIFDRFTQPDNAGQPIDCLMTFLSHSRYFKYLEPVILKDGFINDRLTGEELRWLLVHQAGDGPYSSTTTPQLLRQAAFDLLKAAKEKYR